MTTLQLTIATLVLAVAPRIAAGQQITTELPDSLVAKAKVTEADARAKALAKVPNGTPTSVELEREHGHLQYSYDFTVPGQKETTEVNVDAITGKILGVKKEAADKP
jgi:uncharacterized membrane protein YkoI